MIKDYDIIDFNGEQLLCLYINIDMEFGRFNKRAKKDFVNQIKDYIKKNKVIFNGTKVALIASGALLGTVLLTKPSAEETPLLPPSSLAVLVDSKVPVEKEEKKEEPIKEEVTIKEPTKKEDTKKPVTNQTNSSIKIPSKPPKEDSSNTIKPPTETKENKTFITLKRANKEMVTLELEEYVIGVVAAEMPAAFHKEALKAQAVIARTYALKATERGTPLTDTSSTQNYKDNQELKKLWGNSFNTYYQKVQSAVNETKGMYLTYKGNLIEAVYHSTSNGQTENSENVWQNAFPYLVSVESIYDVQNPSFLKEVSFTYEQLENKLNLALDSNCTITILKRTDGNRVEQIKINDTIYKGVDFRNKLGLRSADFSINKTDTGVIITTKGFGHGVGLSQYGANGMAKQGATYKEILTHYYQGVSLERGK